MWPITRYVGAQIFNVLNAHQLGNLIVLPNVNLLILPSKVVYLYISEFVLLLCLLTSVYVWFNTVFCEILYFYEVFVFGCYFPNFPFNN